MWDWLTSKKTPADRSSGVNEQSSGAAHAGGASASNAGQTREMLIVITGTSGSGRKGAAKRLSEELGIPYVRSYTTRAKRPNETDDGPYRFVSETAFRDMADSGAFCQTVELERGSYGIAEEDLQAALSEKKAAIVVVNREGAQAFKQRFGRGALRIFLYVTKEDVQVRLEKEKAPPEVIEEYLRNYTDQVHYKHESEYLLQNMDPLLTVEKIKAYFVTQTSQNV